MTQRADQSDRHTTLQLVQQHSAIDMRALRSVQAARATRASLIRPRNRFMPEAGQGMACAFLGLFDLCLIGFLVWQILHRH